MNSLTLPRTPDISELGPDDYFAFYAPDEVEVMSSRELHELWQSEHVMSLRLSTGIVGELNCRVGNQGPKGPSEIVAGVGTEGISTLLQLGSLPCHECLSANSLLELRDEEITAQLEANADGSIEHALSREWLTQHYDTRRLDWTMLTMLGVSPGRLYVRPRTSREEAYDLMRRFNQRGLDTPVIGYYDATHPDEFQKIL